MHIAGAEILDVAPLRCRVFSPEVLIAAVLDFDDQYDCFRKDT
jgi:hypothetical protein